VAVDPSDPTIVYGFDDEYFIKTTDAGANWALTFPTPTTMGLGLTNGPPPAQRAIALDQNGTVPPSRIVYVSEGAVLNKSIDAGVHFTPTTLTLLPLPSPPGNYVTCIVTHSIAPGVVWAGAADGSIHCSLDSGGTWDAAPLVTTPGGAGVSIGPVNHIAIDPNTPSRIAVVYGGVSGIHSKYRTRHVFLSLDSGATWNDVSGTDGNGPVGNLPDLPLRSVVFDTSNAPNPPAILVAGDAGVLRSTDAAVSGTGSSAVGTATWKIYGAGLPMVCCNSLAIDNTVKPPILRVGTYGRSCYEVSRPTGPSFASDNNLAFGAVATGQSVTLPFYVYNCGSASLDISAASILGTAPFTMGATPALPVSIAPAATQAFQVTFAPTAAGDVFVLLEITSNDPTQATRMIPASGTGVTTNLVQRLATNPISTAGFGTVTTGSNRTIPVQLFNVGTAPLNIASITLSNGSTDFTLTPAPTFPLAIPAGGESDITLQFAPSGAGLLTAEFTIASDDPRTPLKLNASGTGNLATSGFWSTFLTTFGLAHP
jgi:Abnormal spindle-like microcephaly-assoc'd, ASPM-SPD-2-Hydin